MNEWLDTPVSPDVSRRVHSGVMKRIRRRRNVRRGVGALAVLAALGVSFWPGTPDLEMLAFTPPPPPAASIWVPPSPPKRPPILLAQAPSRPAERITIYTDDPDVVIVLVADGGEE